MKFCEFAPWDKFQRLLKQIEVAQLYFYSRWLPRNVYVFLDGAFTRQSTTNIKTCDLHSHKKCLRRQNSLLDIYSFQFFSASLESGNISSMAACTVYNGYVGGTQFFAPGCVENNQDPLICVAAKISLGCFDVK